MKNKLLLLLTIIFSVFLFSCSQNAEVKNETKKTESKKVPVTFTLSDCKDLINYADVNRSAYLDETESVKFTPENFISYTYDESTQKYAAHYNDVLEIAKIEFNISDENLMTWESDSGINSATYAFHSTAALEKTTDKLCAYEKMIRYINYGAFGTDEYLLLDEGYYCFNIKMYSSNNQLLAFAENSTYISLYTADFYYDKDNRQVWLLKFITKPAEKGVGDCEITLLWNKNDFLDVKVGIFKYANANRPYTIYDLEDVDSKATIQGDTATGVYSKTNVNAGEYFLRIEAEVPNQTNKQIYLNNMSIEPGRKTTGTYTFEVKESYVSITYNLNGGEWKDFTPVEKVSSYLDLLLPGAYAVYKDGFEFDGWYNNSECTGDPVINIPSNTISNQVLFAKWVPAKKYHLGDLILADGTVIKPADVQPSDDVVSVIIKEADYENPAVGVYVKEQKNNTAFASRRYFDYVDKKTAPYDYNRSVFTRGALENIYTNKVTVETVNGADGVSQVIFEGDTEGYDNWLGIKKWLRNRYPGTSGNDMNRYKEVIPQLVPGAYPAYEWVDSITDLNDWYIPSIAELYDFIGNANKNENVKEALETAEFALKERYVSSSQYYYTGCTRDYAAYNTDTNVNNSKYDSTTGYGKYFYVNDEKYYSDLYKLENNIIDLQDFINLYPVVSSYDILYFRRYYDGLQPSRPMVETFQSSSAEYSDRYIQLGVEPNNMNWLIQTNGRQLQGYRKYFRDDDTYFVAFRRFDENAPVEVDANNKSAFTLNSGSEFQITVEEDYNIQYFDLDGDNTKETKDFAYYYLDVFADAGYTDYKFYINGVEQTSKNVSGSYLGFMYMFGDSNSDNVDFTKDAATVLVTAINPKGKFCSACFSLGKKL